ncbi:N-alpha-acetyltransferase 30 [Coemansia sp. Benny D115]|nr:N-alpha-acetyltransferase 30 [Coemansia sp. Benny D115]
MSLDPSLDSISYSTYKTDADLLPAIELIEEDLSEPYTIYTYRFFVHQWPELCIFAHATPPSPPQPEGAVVVSEGGPNGGNGAGARCVGVVICKMEEHRRRGVDGYFDDEKTSLMRGYIGMVAVDKKYRKRGIGSSLVVKALERMREMGADEVILEAVVNNKGALAMYEALGFIRDKRLHRYYLGGIDAYRLKLWF